MKKLIKSTWGQYLCITLGTLIVAFGVYLFKFPNNFTFGGVTGVAVLAAKLLPFSPSMVTYFVNVVLLIFGFIFLGKQFGLKTVYASLLLSTALALLEKFLPLAQPLTQEPFLEFTLAIILPAVGAAILFYADASGGGTDIPAVIIRKFTGLSVGISLFIIDSLIVISAFFVFGIEKGLFAVAGLTAKTFIINSVIDSFNTSKYFTIICSDPQPICDYINKELRRGATVFNATGAFTNEEKHIIFTALYPEQAMKLRTAVRQMDPKAFIMITSSSEIFGRGFQN